MKSYRIPRLQTELSKLLNITLSQKVRNPQLAWVQVSHVKLSKDLRYAKIYFTHYNNPAGSKEIRDLLYKTSGFFKKQIAGAQLMRTIPELSFQHDNTEERAAKVEALLARIKDRYDDDDDHYDPDIDLDDLLEEDDYDDFFDDDDEDDYEDYFDDEDEDEDEY
jgi:ribosome-binding factor A